MRKITMNMLDGAGFANRAAFVQWAAITALVSVGMTVKVGGCTYRYDGVSSGIADLPGWIWDEKLTLRHFGAAGNGTTNDSAAFLAAVATATASNTPLHISPGDYNLALITTPVVTGNLVIIGESNSSCILKGASTKDMVSLTGGGSFITRGVFYKEWLSVARLRDNTSTGIFGTIEVRDCALDGIRQSAVSDTPYYAPSGITLLNFIGNTCTNIGQVSSMNSAALRVESALIMSAFILHNEIRGVGGPAFTGQKAGLSLGGVSLSSLSSMIVEGNRVYDVSNDGTGGGGGGGVSNCSGIILFGQNTRVVNNSVNNVKSTNSNVDQYGIYTKSSYSTILGNTLLNAGGNASCIMTKGYPNDNNGRAFNADDFSNIIANNVIRIETRWTSAVNKYVGITTYNRGMNIHDNIIDGVTYGIYVIGQGVPAGDVGRTMIHHNKIFGLFGGAGGTVLGIRSDDPNSILVESNTIRNIGSGVESTVIGIWMESVNTYTMSDVILRGNVISTLLATTTSSARGIFFNQANIAALVTNVMIDDNSILSAGRGIQLNFVGVANKMSVRGNSFDGMVDSNFDFSGTAPVDAVLSKNIINGHDYIAVASGTTALRTDGADHLIINNTTATTIAGFSRSFGNQVITLEIVDGGLTTIANNSVIQLSTGASWTPTAGGILVLRKVGAVFKEISRTPAATSAAVVVIPPSALNFAPNPVQILAATTTAVNVDAVYAKLPFTAGPTGCVAITVTAYYEWTATDTLYWRIVAAINSPVCAVAVGVSGEKKVVTATMVITGMTAGQVSSAYLQHYSTNSAIVSKIGGSGGGLLPALSMVAIPF